jgi:hypothetical protein
MAKTLPPAEGGFSPTLDVDQPSAMTRMFLGPRQFAKLENWCATTHKLGTQAQECRARWKAQLDRRRGHLTARQRGGPTADEDRWLDATTKDLLFISLCRTKPRGVVERAVADIFGDQ